MGSETGFLTKILRRIPKIMKETRFLHILMKAVNFSFITKFWGIEENWQGSDGQSYDDWDKYYLANKEIVLLAAHCVC